MLNHDIDVPPPLPTGGLRILPLGGIGEIGRNMTVFEIDGKLLIVDLVCCSRKSHIPVLI